MVVELKKVKITKSIFDQLLSPLLNDLSKYEVLGWVFHKARYILLYDPDSKSLFRMPVITDMKIEQQRPWIVNFMQKGYAASVKLSGYHESNQWITKVHEVQVEARIKGQVFI